VFKEIFVFDMHHLGWGEKGEAWRWRRRLFAWEEEVVGELMLLLHNVHLQVDRDDRWRWTLESSNVFSVRSAYNFLSANPPFVLFAWRLFRDRLPTKDNLHRRGVLDRESMLCVAGCGSIESSQHLFLHCNIFGVVWYFIYRWLGISVVIPAQVTDHSNQFSVSGGIAKTRCSISQVIWFATVWEIWKERNNKHFNDKECSISQVVDKIKSLAFRWLKEKFPTLPFNYHGWWLSPFTMLGIR